MSGRRLGRRRSLRSLRFARARRRSRPARMTQQVGSLDSPTVAAGEGGIAADPSAATAPAPVTEPAPAGEGTGSASQPADTSSESWAADSTTTEPAPAPETPPTAPASHTQASAVAPEMERAPQGSEPEASESPAPEAAMPPAASPRAASAPLNARCDALDSVFQRYAPCMGTDWRILKAIAAVESGCKASARNSAGYIGIGQTNVRNCKSIFKSRGYSRLTSYCTEDNLTRASVGIAIVALLQKKTATYVRKHCPRATPAEQGAVFHAFNNVPAAALRMIRAGCQDKEKFIDYYRDLARSTKAGDVRRRKAYQNTPSYKRKYGSILSSQGEEAYLAAIGRAKIDYAIQKAGPVFEKLGGSIFGSASGGSCPLDGDKPFQD